MESLRNNLPIFSVAIVIISLVRLIVFYSSFGISIVSYIDLTEALMLSIPFFVYGFIFQTITIFLLVILFIVGIVLSVLTDKVIGKNKVAKEQVRITNEDESIFQFLFRNWTYVLNIIALSVFSIVKFIARDLDSLSYILATYIFFILLIMAKSSVIDSISKKLHIDYNQVKLFYIVAALTSVSIASSKMEASTIKKLSTGIEYRTQVYVELNGKKIVTSNKYRYVGKTKSYIFFYNLNNRRAEAYPLNDAKGLAVIEPKLFNYFD